MKCVQQGQAAFRKSETLKRTEGAKLKVAGRECCSIRRLMLESQKFLICGTDESLVTKLVAQRSAYGSVDFEIGPKSSREEIERTFRSSHREAVTVLIRLALTDSVKVMDRRRQEELLPFIDDFSGLLLILYSPIFVPIIRPLRSRCEIPDFIPEFEFHKPRGSFRFLAEVLDSGGDRALRRSARSSLESMMRYVMRGTL